MAPNKSKARRTRVVPNRRYDHRPSSCMAGRRPSHFFKIIVPSTIDDKKLSIPEKFVRELGDELSDVATLTGPNGHFWQVGLEKGRKPTGRFSLMTDVPVEFAIKHLSGHRFVKLETCDGRQWRARCSGHGTGCSASARNIGWAQFCRDNNLKEGDVCVIVLIKRNPVVLKISVFHAADYQT
ncbi:hypothetical protein FH972_015904 [Carpinus fangiana]|uniref:TF-B3 domain-containing protein n=1 Tax=Carpinus fangiana TaxID=176857 RepID=A0A5N6REI8_9ROSI|nr:hypothetical protein FH972_015904 [Carpinus fangiana]